MDGSRSRLRSAAANVAGSLASTRCRRQAPTSRGSAVTGCQACTVPAAPGRPPGRTPGACAAGTAVNGGAGRRRPDLTYGRIRQCSASGLPHTPCGVADGLAIPLPYAGPKERMPGPCRGVRDPAEVRRTGRSVRACTVMDNCPSCARGRSVLSGSVRGHHVPLTPVCSWRTRGWSRWRRASSDWGGGFGYADAAGVQVAEVPCQSAFAAAHPALSGPDRC